MVLGITPSTKFVYSLKPRDSRVVPDFYLKVKDKF